MSQKRGRLSRFLQEHPLCFACGSTAVEEDHLPSRACFDGKEWPEHFSFPVCSSCNRSTANDEQIIAALSRTHSSPAAPVRQHELTRYLSGASNNDPVTFQRLLVREVGQGPDGTSLIELGPGVKECFDRVLPKWARAFHYLETREILPPNQKIFGKHFTLPDVVNGRVPPELFQLQPRPITRNKKDLSDQFGYASSVADTCAIYVVVFRRAIGAWMAVDKNDIDKDPEADFSLLPVLRSLKK